MTQHLTLMTAAAPRREPQASELQAGEVHQGELAPDAIAPDAIAPREITSRLVQQPHLQRFETVREQVEAGAQGQWDTIVRRRDLTIRDGQVTFAFDKLGEHQESLSPSPWATAQLCTRLGIPVSYYRKCPTVLQDVQANYWLKNGRATAHGQRSVNGNSVTEASAEDDPGVGDDSNDDGFGFLDGNDETNSASHRHSHNGSRERVNEQESVEKSESAEEQWLLRARHGDLRAVLSERYSPLDNDELMATLAPLLASRYRVDWFALGEESLHLRIIDPTRLREVLPDDPLSVGIHITNSEVGKRSVGVDALVYRLVCSNGLIRLIKGKSLLKRRHVHLSRPRFRASLEEALHKALNTAESFVDQLERIAQERVPDVEGTLEKLGERWHLSQHTQDAVKIALSREPTSLQDTLYGLVNGFTQVAQGLANDDRYDLEVLAGRLAENGLPAFARSKREKSFAVKSAVASVAGPTVEDDNETAAEPAADGEMVESSISEPSIIDLAREMFDAEIVDSTSSLSTSSLSTRAPLEVAG